VVTATIEENAIAFQSVPNTAEITLRGEVETQTFINTFYAKFPAAYDEGDIAGLAAAVNAWALTDWITCVGPQYTFLETHVRGLTAGIDFEAAADNIGIVGTAGSTPLPNNVALSVKRQSAFTGRGARGRIYIGALTEEVLDSVNTVNPTYAGVVIDALYAMNAAIVAEGWLPVIVHRRSGGVLLGPAVTFELITWNIVDMVLDSQRRRLPGRGI
jgi:hypothetical protein